MINLFEPNVGEESIQLLKKVINSRWLGRGEYVQEFEKKTSEFLQIDPSNFHTISCCSDAIFGAFDILEIYSGEIIIPSISFPAVGSAILDSKLTPVIVDIDFDSGNIDIGEMLKHLSPRTKAVFITHYGGIPVDTQRLRASLPPEVKIIEDAACAFGTFVRGNACGTAGDYGCWSFDAMKMLTCGEGGGLYLKDPHLVTKAKEYFYLGLPAQGKSGIDRVHSEARWWEYQLNLPGRRSIFTNINAAIGLPQFQGLRDSFTKRQKFRTYYEERFKGLNGLTFLEQNDPEVIYSNYFFTVLTDKRDQLAAHLKKRGIYSTFRYYPLHLIELFKDFARNCPKSAKFSEMALNIPIHHGLSDADCEKIADSVREFYL